MIDLIKIMFSKITGYFSPGRPMRMSAFFWIAAITMILDQLTKQIMWHLFDPKVFPINGTYELVKTNDPIVLIPNFLQFMFRINTGAAFSSLTGRTGFLTIVSLVISLGVVAWAWFLKPGEQGLRLSQGLIFGGAVGNLIDRVWYGYVIDFIDVFVVYKGEPHHYPTFNVADSAICVGIFLMAVASFCVSQSAAPAAAPISPSTPTKEASRGV